MNHAKTSALPPAAATDCTPDACGCRPRGTMLDRRQLLKLGGLMATGMAFSRQGPVLAVSSIEGVISLWNYANAAAAIDVLRGHLLGVNDVAFSPDGERLASASAKYDEAVKLWDPKSGHEVATLAGDGSLFSRLKFSPDGALLMAINRQGQAHLWRAPLLQEIRKIEEARPPVSVAEIR